MHRATGKKRTAEKKKEKTATIEISGLGSRGEGVHREKGVTVYVHGALPGERVLCGVRWKNDKVGEGRIRRLLTRSPARIEPGCVAYGKGCGGCQLLHMEYGKQCEWKTDMVRETLSRGGVRPSSVQCTIRAREHHHGRNKLTLGRDDRGVLGMRPEQSTRVLPVTECMQEMPVNMAVYATLSRMRFPDSVTQIHLRAQNDGRAGMHFFSKEASNHFHRLARAILRKEPRIVGIGVRTYRGYEHLEGDDCTTHREKGLVYGIPHPGFFQTNYAQAGRLLEVVLEYTEAGRYDSICDIYSGCGFFSLPVAMRAKSVVCMESSVLSVRAAILNAERNRISNVKFVRCDAGEGLRRAREGEFDTVILDPPRAGCEETVLDRIIRIRPKKIVYVSCSPIPLSADLRLLKRSGYLVTRCQPVDMFPHTSHIEVVVQLVMNNENRS